MGSWVWCEGGEGVCDVEWCVVGMLWGHGYGVREGKVCVMLSGLQWEGYGVMGMV
jgi:hypothetical protein